MKLDKRIKSISDIYTSFDVGDIEKYKGQRVYCANELKAFTNLKNYCVSGILTDVEADEDTPYLVEVVEEDYEYYFDYVIPESKLLKWLKRIESEIGYCFWNLYNKGIWKNEFNWSK